jgi:hypothetical protein
MGDLPAPHTSSSGVSSRSCDCNRFTGSFTRRYRRAGGIARRIPRNNAGSIRCGIGAGR